MSRMLISVLAFGVLASSAWAVAPKTPLQAPWPYTISADFPEVPAMMQTYKVASQPVVTLETLKDVFGLTGTPIYGDDLGGMEKVSSGAAQAFSFDLGGAIYIDGGNLEQKIQPASADQLWAESEALLEDLGLMQDPILAWQPDRVGERRVELHNGSGRVVSSWISGQAAAWKATVDGWQTFGGGSELDVLFGDQAAIIGLTAAPRVLIPTEEIVIDGPQKALSHYLAHATATGRWSILKTATPSLRHVDITDIQLGYWMSDISQKDPVVAPVYEIKGVITFGAEGALQQTELCWYEPASASVNVPDLFPKH